MARTAVTVTEVSRSANPEQPAQQASDDANGMTVPNHDGRVVFEVEASGGACTLEFLVPGSVDGNAVAARSLVVAEGKTRLIGPFPPGVYNQPNGSLSINASSPNGKIRAYHF